MKKDKKRQHAAPTTDARFARLHTDPRFLRPRRDDSKVVVDDRFKAMLDGGTEFGVYKRNSKIDRFGRKQRKGLQAAQELKKLYRLDRDGSKGEQPSDDEEDEDDNDDDKEEEREEEEDGDSSIGSGNAQAFVDYARGAVDLKSSSDEDDEDENDSASSASSDDSDPGEVRIGRSDVLRKEHRRRAKASYSDQKSSDDQVDVDDGAEREIDSNVLAAWDAQAARVVAAADDEAHEGSAKAGPSSRPTAMSRRSKNRKQATIPYGEETRRLAVVNMDWDHIRAIDLYKVFTSLVSPIATRLPGAMINEEAGTRGNGASSAPIKGTVEMIRVYPSDFGKERMKREDIEGPPKDIFMSATDDLNTGGGRKKGKKKEHSGTYDNSEDENALFQEDDGGEFNEEALRKYQLERLRYYYAIATFDSPQSARHVYDAVDGAEMEKTANIFDLQFVPDEMDFPDHRGGDDGWRDEAKPGFDDSVAYKGAEWATDALRHSKVKLTWDAPDPDRLKVTRRKGLTKDQLRDEDFKAYLATDSEASNEDAHGAIQGATNSASRDRYRALIGLDGADGSGGKSRGKSVFEDARLSDDEDDGPGGEVDMEITFMPGLSELAARKDAGGFTKEGEEETTLDKYLRKQREKKQRRKAAKTAVEGVDGAGSDVAEAAVRPTRRVMSKDPSFEDSFFTSDSDDEEPDLEVILAKEQVQTASQQGRKDHGENEATRTASTAKPKDDAADQYSDDARKHFSLQDLLKAERGSKRLNRWERKKLAKQAKRRQHQDEVSSAASYGGCSSNNGGEKLRAQQGFKVDVADPRFAGALMKDHEFALDPTHPSFTPTEGMKKLLEERRRVNAVDFADQEEVQAQRRRDAQLDGGDEEEAAVGKGQHKRKAEGAGQSARGAMGVLTPSLDDPAALLKSLKQRHQASQHYRGKGKKMGTNVAFGIKKRKVVPSAWQNSS